jgi:glyoxylase-like metal-dependent hydrolase (beta-lactamase superfamily II)
MGPPVKLPGMIQDKEAYLETIAYIVELAKKENAEIWFGHDLEQYQTLVKANKGYYE